MHTGRVENGMGWDGRVATGRGVMEWVGANET